MDLEEKFRDEFPVRGNRIFFDHAKVAPLPRRVADVVRNFVGEAAEHGTAHYARWMAHAETVREHFARFINAGADEIAFVKNTSEGISIVANGLDWKAGDNVVIPDIEFPANVYPWMNLERFGVETRFVRSVEGRVPFDSIAARVDARTRVVSVSSVECNSGFRNDLTRLGAFCRERGILFCVDAIQSLGVLPMDVRRDHIDFLAADGHKWLLSVEGLGGFFISNRVLERVHPVMVGWDSVINAQDFLNYDFTFRPGARRFEEGSFNTMSIHAFGAALSLLMEAGVENIQQRVFALGDLLLEGLRQRGMSIINSTLPEERSGIVSFTAETDLQRFAAGMLENRVSLTVRDGLVRVSPHFYNGADEVERFFSILDHLLKKNR